MEFRHAVRWLSLLHWRSDTNASWWRRWPPLLNGRWYTYGVLYTQRHYDSHKYLVSNYELVDREHKAQHRSRKMSHDDRTYKDPMIFNPDRFLGTHPETDPMEFVFGFGRYYSIHFLNRVYIDHCTTLGGVVQEYTLRMQPFTLGAPCLWQYSMFRWLSIRRRVRTSHRYMCLFLVL